MALALQAENLRDCSDSRKVLDFAAQALKGLPLTGCYEKKMRAGKKWKTRRFQGFLENRTPNNAQTTQTIIYQYNSSK